MRTGRKRKCSALRALKARVPLQFGGSIYVFNHRILQFVSRLRPCCGCFYNLTGSYGVSLILFTLVIKLILLPFQMKSKKSMVRMSRMSGKMQEIQKKYANNQLKMQEEMQKFYQEEGFNPMSGCLWSFLPLPILMALYYIIREPIVYFMNFGGKDAGLAVAECRPDSLIEGAGIDDRGQPRRMSRSPFPTSLTASSRDFIAEHPGWVNIDYHFLGIDLIQPRPGASVSSLSTGITLAADRPDSDSHHFRRVQLPAEQGHHEASPAQTDGCRRASTKMMMWMMPLMSIYIAFIVPAALGVYWIAQSAFSIIQEMVLGKFYTKKLQEEEDARQEMPGRRTASSGMEEAKLLQEQQRQQAAQKKSLKEKRQAAQEAKAAEGQKGRHQHHRGGPGGRPPLCPWPVLQGGPL